MARQRAVRWFFARGWLIAGAVAVCLASCREHRSALESRVIEPRLSRTDWDPFHPHTRGDVVLATRLVANVAEMSTDPHAWNDRAAVLHENAMLYNAPELLADSLTACDRALWLAPELPEALFNRALVLEWLGLRDDAREAWMTYLTRDSGPWAAEAREHLRGLEKQPLFLERVDRADPAALRVLARSNPSDTRSLGTANILGRWGSAVAKNDTREAERQLAIARELGRELVRFNGDLMLAQAVAAIDATHDRLILAAAHVDYDQ